MADQVYIQAPSNDAKTNNIKFAENLKSESTLCLFLTKSFKDYYIIVTKRDFQDYEELFMNVKKLGLTSPESYTKVYAYARKTDMGDFEFQIFEGQDMSEFPADDKLNRLFGSSFKYKIETIDMPDENERAILKMVIEQ